MWCEEGWCGHYRDGTEQSFPEEPPIDQCALSASRPINTVDVSVLSNEAFFENYEGQEDIPMFSQLEEFVFSEFFNKYYDMWEQNLEWKWMWNICEQEHEEIKSENWQVIMLRPVINKKSTKPAENLQRILIALWYLNWDNLDPSRSYNHELWIREINILYLGVLWQAEHMAVRQFQANNNLNPTWIIGNQEKNILYSQIFKIFHKFE